MAFAALSDPTRRAILNRLRRGPATVNELAKPFEFSQQAVSKHLAYLERARLIVKHRRGRRHYCVLKPNALRGIADWTAGYRQFWEESLARLDALLPMIKQKEQRHGRKK